MRRVGRSSEAQGGSHGGGWSACSSCLPPFSVGWAYWHRSERLLRKYDARTHFSVGGYLLGFEDHNSVTGNVECVVGPHDFVFAKMSRTALGKIPPDAVEEVAIDDKPRITHFGLLTTSS